jgi:hypothetical protein
MPRWFADLVTRRRRTMTYRTWIDGARGYKRLLHEARFTGATGSRLTCLVFDALAVVGLRGQIVDSLCIIAVQL